MIAVLGISLNADEGTPKRPKISNSLQRKVHFVARHTEQRHLAPQYEFSQPTKEK